MMTKNIFIATANIIKTIKGTEQHANLINLYVELFEKENPRFDKRIFIKACGGNC